MGDLKMTNRFITEIIKESIENNLPQTAEEIIDEVLNKDRENNK